MDNANWPNRTLFHGDNLRFLRAMNSESVDLTATDPPFNKGRDFHATPDSLAAGAKFQDRWSWERDVHQDWVDQITDDYPRLMEAIESARYAHSDGMGAFMCFMAVRLLAMRRVLKPTGSIYLHCDPTASHYLKAVMDAIFGWRNFRNEIIWKRTNAPTASPYQFGCVHDKLLLFAASGATQLRPVFIPYTQEYVNKHYRQGDKHGKFHTAPLMHKEFGAVMGASRERTGYPTQKPLALLERIIQASSKQGDIALDPFAGCATTLVAAERLERQWVGMDIWDNAEAVVLQRLEQEGLIGEGSDGLHGHLFSEDVHFTAEPPARTDDGSEAAPFLRVKERIREPEGRKMSRAEMYEFLLTEQGAKDATGRSMTRAISNSTTTRRALAPADVRLVYLDRTAERPAVAAPRLADALEHEPGARLGYTDVPMQLHGRHALEARDMQADRVGPLAQAHFRLFHERADLHGEVGSAIRAPVGHLVMRCLAGTLTPAAWATAAVGPDLRLEPLTSRALRREQLRQLLQGDAFAIRFSGCYVSHDDLPLDSLNTGYLGHDVNPFS